jgi:hypothetical protein
MYFEVPGKIRIIPNKLLSYSFSEEFNNTYLHGKVCHFYADIIPDFREGLHKRAAELVNLVLMVAISYRCDSLCERSVSPSDGGSQTLLPACTETSHFEFF